jgi:hypothetical protein
MLLSILERHKRIESDHTFHVFPKGHTTTCITPTHPSGSTDTHTTIPTIGAMKIPPKSAYTSVLNTQSDTNNGDKVKMVDGKEEERGEEYPYDIENTLEKLDYEDRKWLLFQLVVCQPIFLDEVDLGFPMSLVPDDDVVKNEEFEGSRDGQIRNEADRQEDLIGPLSQIAVGEDKKGKGKTRADELPDNANISSSSPIDKGKQGVIEVDDEIRERNEETIGRMGGGTRKPKDPLATKNYFLFSYHLPGGY